MNFPPNRALRDESGRMYDIVFGTFFLCGAPADSDHFTSLIPEQIERYQKRYYIPEIFWGAAFINNRLPLPKLCQLLQAVHATSEDWENALPCDGGTDVGDMGMFLAEKLIARHPKIRWEHRLIAVNSLWLAGVTDCSAPKSCTFSEYVQSFCCGQHEEICFCPKAEAAGQTKTALS